MDQLAGKCQIKEIYKQLGVWILLVGILVMTACSGTAPAVTKGPAAPLTERPKNVILMIGDGLGLTQISAAMYSNNNRLSLESFPVIGFHKSHSSNELITDSAAGATAFACGVKTYIQSIGMDADTLPARNIIEEAEAHDMATGLVATSTIVHATPAAFIAHQPMRIMYEQIAADFLKTEIDLFIGGGKKYFDRRDTDNRNLIKELENKGYFVTDYLNSELNHIRLPKDPKAQNFVHFTADKHPLPVSAGRNYLTYASTLAANFLEQHSDEGFFLMIEGSQIDWAGHSNDGNLVIKESLDFDRAISAVLDFARKRGNTLVIITADHETGGMAIQPGSKFGKIKTAFTTNGHTAQLVPVFAYGPGAELFAGIYDNTEIYFKMRKALGFSSQDLPPSIGSK